MIPRIIIQTSRNKPEQYIVDMIESCSPNWMYFHFNDEEVNFNIHPIMVLLLSKE